MVPRSDRPQQVRCLAGSRFQDHGPAHSRARRRHPRHPPPPPLSGAINAGIDKIIAAGDAQAGQDQTNLV